MDLVRVKDTADIAAVCKYENEQHKMKRHNISFVLTIRAGVALDAHSNTLALEDTNLHAKINLAPRDIALDGKPTLSIHMQFPDDKQSSDKKDDDTGIFVRKFSIFIWHHDVNQWTEIGFRKCVHMYETTPRLPVDIKSINFPNLMAAHKNDAGESKYLAIALVDVPPKYSLRASIPDLNNDHKFELLSSITAIRSLKEDMFLVSSTGTRHASHRIILCLASEEWRIALNNLVEKSNGEYRMATASDRTIDVLLDCMYGTPFQDILFPSAFNSCEEWLDVIKHAYLYGLQTFALATVYSINKFPAARLTMASFQLVRTFVSGLVSVQPNHPLTRVLKAYVQDFVLSDFDSVIFS